MLTDSMIPESFEHGGRKTGLARCWVSASQWR
jgi:hypothetical protein